MWRLVIRPEISLIELKQVPIFEQLQLEEALLKGSEKSFCLLNCGVKDAIVMGISSKPEHLIDLEEAKRQQIPIIRRFSGGGTVVVDENTLFITFIFSKDLLKISPFPEPILKWSAEVYEKCWQIPGFSLRENDYCINHLKCGGNAQYIRKNRWLHHTSFLWDYSREKMKCLRLPEKRPKYRLNRSHEEFLVKLNAHKSKEELIDQFKRYLSEKFEVASFDPNTFVPEEHRQSTQIENFC